MYRMLRSLDSQGVIPYILSACAIILAIIMAICIVKIIIRLIRKKERRVGVIVLFVLLCLYLVGAIWKLSYYFDGGKKTVTPELVAVIPAEEQLYGIVQTYYKIDKAPFRLETIYQPVRSYSQNISDEEIQRYLDDDYTYIVSYGRSVERISYTCWFGYDKLPAPWNGLVYLVIPEDVIFDQEGVPEVFIYRIPKTAIETR